MIRTVSLRLMLAVGLLLPAMAGSTYCQSRNSGNTRTDQGHRTAPTPTDDSRQARVHAPGSGQTPTAPPSIRIPDPVRTPFRPPQPPATIVEVPVIVQPDAPIVIVEPVQAVCIPSREKSSHEHDMVGVRLSNRLARPAWGGYSFAKVQLLPWDEDDVDLRYEAAGVGRTLVVPDDTRIIDLGPVREAQDIGGAPPMTSSDRWATAVAGHGYVLRLWDRALIGLRVASVTEEEVVFDWLQFGRDSRREGVSFGK